jgi:hypothetical protein
VVHEVALFWCIEILYVPDILVFTNLFFWHYRYVLRLDIPITAVQWLLLPSSGITALFKLWCHQPQLFVLSVCFQSVTHGFLYTKQLL